MTTDTSFYQVRGVTTMSSSQVPGAAVWQARRRARHAPAREAGPPTGETGTGKRDKFTGSDGRDRYRQARQVHRLRRVRQAYPRARLVPAAETGSSAPTSDAGSPGHARCLFQTGQTGQSPGCWVRAGGDICQCPPRSC